MRLSLGFLYFFITWVTLGHAATLEDCPRGLHRDRYLQVRGDYCYYFMTFKSQDFDHAQRDCKSQGGSLVYVKDKATQDYLYTRLKSMYHVTDPVWIGFTDDDEESVWEWLDGSKPEYTNWASDQPGLASTVEDCAAIEMDDGGKWHDFRCNDFLFIDFGHPYVCQYGPYKPSNTITMMTTTIPTQTTTTPPITKTMTTTTTPPTTTTTATAPPTTTTTANTPPLTTTTSTTPPPTTITATTPPQTTTTTTTPPPTTTTTTTPPPTITTTTTPPPTTTTATSQQPTTAQTTTTTQSTTTTVPTTTTAQQATTKTCPPLNCPTTVDCGFDGYQTGPDGCFTCQCAT